MNVLVNEYFESTQNDLDVIYDQLKLWTRLDTIYCLEATDGKKEGVITKIVNFIKKIINEARALIKKGIDSLSNHVRYGLLSKKQKEKFRQFQEFVKTNPKVKNKKVTVKDWQRIMREYDKIEKNIVKYMNDDTVDARGLNMKANEMFTNLASLANSATAAVTVDLCLSLARKSPEMAQMVQAGLSKCSSVIANIEDELGEAEAKKLQDKLTKLTKESTAQKILSVFYHKKEKDIITCITEVTGTFEKLMSGEAGVIDKVSAAVEHRDFVRAGAKAYVRNSATRKGVKQVANTVKGIKSDSTVQSAMSSAKEFFKPKV